MSTILFSTSRTITTATATTEAAGYPATNVGLPQIARMWRSTSTSAQTITITISSAACKGVFVTHCNFSTATIEYDNSGWVSLGTFNTREDVRLGRRYGAKDIGSTGVTTTQFRITPSGSPTDGVAYWYIGAIYVFGARYQLERSPNLDEVSTVDRNVDLRRLANGRTVAFARNQYDGRAYRMSWVFQQSEAAGSVYPIAQVIGSARVAGTPVGLIWPHYYLPQTADPDTGVFQLGEESIEESDRGYRVRETSVMLEEVY